MNPLNSHTCNNKRLIQSQPTSKRTNQNTIAHQSRPTKRPTKNLLINHWRLWQQAKKLDENKKQIETIHTAYRNYRPVRFLQQFLWKPKKKCVKRLKFWIFFFFGKKLLTCLCSESNSRSMALSMRTPALPDAMAARSSWLMYMPRGGLRLWRPPRGAPRLPPPGPDVGRNRPVRLPISLQRQSTDFI